MQLKPEVTITITLNHQQLALLRQAMGQMPFDLVRPLMGKFDQQLNEPHNQIEQPEAADGDDAGNA